MNMHAVQTVDDAFIPEMDDTFVPNGNYDDIHTILSSGLFLPMLLSGPTGAGKTKMIEQIHANLGRQLVRANITIETDEDSLMGGFRLRGGETVFAKGPVIQAMELGATLLLDELDLANPMKIMCLQSVLENAGYLIKKTGEFIKPNKGFSIVATANTKGFGDEDGNYVGTQTLNAAMLDRFTLVFDCDYPTKSVEVQILQKVLNKLKHTISDEDVNLLVDWASSLRTAKLNTFDLEFSVSTRRLVDILKIDKIFNNLDNSIKMSLNRFDARHQQAFLEQYRSLKPSKGKTPDSSDPFDGSNILRM